MLVVDLDTSRGGRTAVVRDASAVAELVKKAGGRAITDESPTGGIHVYIPLTLPVPFHDARDFALALARRLPSMDPSPNQNLAGGLIRPPGSRHRAGGYQRLHGPLSAAVAIASTGNAQSVWRNLRTAVSSELADLKAHQQASPTGTIDDAPHRPRPGGSRELAHDYLTIARTGTWTDGRYRSPSEARMAVITAAAWAGHTLTDVMGRMQSGQWPGLASLYAKYSAGSRNKTLRTEWANAHQLIASRTASPGKAETITLVRRSPTSELSPHGGSPEVHDQQESAGTVDEFRWIRSWWGALEIAEVERYRSTKAGLSRRMVLRALGEAAMKTGSRFVEFGTRSLAIAAGLDHTTVAAHLRALLEEPDPMIDRLATRRGLRGDLYTLRIPDEIEARATRRPWRGGRLQALRPVFHELGRPAALVYEALEHGGRGRLQSFEVVETTGLSRTAVWDALQLLAAHDLVDQSSAGWRTTTRSLSQLADQFGVLEKLHNVVNRHRDERRRYRQALRIPQRKHLTVVGAPDLGAWQPPTSSPPEDDSTVLDLLERVLGARIIEVA